MKRIVILLFLITQSLLAQIQFEAKVNKDTLDLSGKIIVQFVLNVDGGFKRSFFNESSFKSPEFNGFSVIGEPQQIESIMWDKVKFTLFKKVYYYALLPKKKGKFTIKQAKIEYKGKIYKTSPIRIIVTSNTEPSNISK